MRLRKLQGCVSPIADVVRHGDLNKSVPFIVLYRSAASTPPQPPDQISATLAGIAAGFLIDA
jgi:hypothetical protein